MDGWLSDIPQPNVPQKSQTLAMRHVIATQSGDPTAATMKVKYKETARGGLAVNVVEC